VVEFSGPVQVYGLSKKILNSGGFALHLLEPIHRSMKRSIFISLAILVPVLVAATNPIKTSLGFRENKGQVAFADGKPASQVLFKTTGTSAGIFVTTSGMTYVFYQRETIGGTGEDQKNDTRWSKVEMCLQNADIRTENIKTENALPGVANFYYPHCPQGILGVKTWQKVTVADVYPGIDWVLNADEAKDLSYDFIVHPGADVSKIQVLYKGATSISLRENNTKLILRSKYGEITEGALNVFEKGGKKINAAFKVKGKELSYSIAPYDTRYELIIDPPLQWSQKEISSGTDYGNAIAVPRDGTGDAVVTGFAGATDFPTLNAYQGTNGGGDDMVMMRVNGSGTVLWATYYGGSGNDIGRGIAADVSGNCYIAGYTTSTDFPVLSAIQGSNAGGFDLGIVKLNNAGVRQWATYYGGQFADAAYAITCDMAGNSYLTGYTNSGNFPTVTPIQSTKSVVGDAFIMKLDASSVVQWATFYGGDDEDRGRGITLDQAGANVFITGTAIGFFPVTSGCFQNTPASPYNVEDAWVVKLNAVTSVVQYATLCGASDADIAEDIAVDNAGNAYVTGYTFSADYPVFNPGGGAYVDSTIGSIGTHDVFITKINAAGSAAPWSTYMGGASVDMGFGICYDPFFGIYITGSTSSTDFPTQLPADNIFYQSVQGDGGNYYDFFIAWFTTGGALQWSTFYGDGNSNEGRGVDTDAQSNIFVCGADSNNVRIMKFNPGILTGIASMNVAGFSFKLYPVPAQNTLTLEVEMKKAGSVKVEILNAAGSLVRKEVLQSASGKNSFAFDVSALPAGNYLLRLEDAEKISANKFSRVE